MLKWEVPVLVLVTLFEPTRISAQLDEVARRLAAINRMCANATRQVSLDVLDQLANFLSCDRGDLLERDRKRR